MAFGLSPRTLALAVALVLSPHGSASTRATWRWRLTPGRVAPAVLRSHAANGLAGNGMSAALPLFEALAALRATRKVYPCFCSRAEIAAAASAPLIYLAGQAVTGIGLGAVFGAAAVGNKAYVGIGLLGLFLAGGFLDNRLLPIGELGALFSAGAIPLIYSLIGLKVGAEFSSILANLSATEEL